MEPEAAKPADAQEKDGSSHNNFPELNRLLFCSTVPTISVTNVGIVHFWKERTRVARATSTRASRASYRSANFA